MLPTFNGVTDELLAINRARRNKIDPPRIIALTGGSDVVFDARVGAALGDDKVVAKLILHNLGTNPMYYGINQVAGTALGTFHDILAGGTVAKDGLGSLVDLSGDQPEFVTVKGTAGDWIAVVISYPLGTNLS